MASSRRFAAWLAERAFDGVGDQVAELALSLRVTSVVRDASGRPRWDTSTDEELLRVGGRWDRAAHAWTDAPPREAAVIRITRGGAQEAGARWLAAWFRAHVTGDWASFNGGRRAWSALLSGGRRSGKSHLACAALCLYAVLYPGAIVWAVSPTQTETAELETAIRKMLPATWYRYRGAGTGKVSTFTLPHGGQILLLSGFKPAGLRRGRVDFCLYNEGQNMSHAGYVQVRAAIADTAGLVLIAANPPSAPIGRWIEDHLEGVREGKIEGVHFEFNPEENPWVEIAALHSMQAEVDEFTYDRDVLGLMRPIGDVVFHAWHEKLSRAPVPAHLRDVTAEVTRAELGVARAFVVGMDFQGSSPGCVGVVFKFFRDPAAPADLLAWVVGEAVGEYTTEAELAAGLEEAPRWTPTGYVAGGGYKPEECAVVMDASGFWQDSEHHKGKQSDRKLAAVGWRALFKPQKDSDANPDRLERIRTGNARLKTKDQVRHFFVTPQCKATSTALRLWPRYKGSPLWKSEHVHLSDAVTYVLFRFYGRAAVRKGKGKASFQREASRREEFSV